MSRPAATLLSLGVMAPVLTIALAVAVQAADRAEITGSRLRVQSALPGALGKTLVNGLEVRSEALARLDPSRPEQAIRLTLYRSQSPEGPYVKEDDVIVTGKDKRTAKASEKQPGWLTDDTYLLWDRKMEPLVQLGHPNWSKPMCYEVGRTAGIMAEGKFQPLGEEARSSIVPSLQSQITVNGSTDDQVAIGELGVKGDCVVFHVALSRVDQHFDIPGAHFIVSSGDSKFHSYSTRVEEGPHGVVSFADGLSTGWNFSQATIVVPYHRDRNTVTIEAEAGEFRATKKFRLDPEQKVAQRLQEAAGTPQRTQEELKKLQELKARRGSLPKALEELKAKVGKLPEPKTEHDARDGISLRLRLVEITFELRTLEVDLARLQSPPAEPTFDGQVRAVNERLAFGERHDQIELEKIDAQYDVLRQPVLLRKSAEERAAGFKSLEESRTKQKASIAKGAEQRRTASNWPLLRAAAKAGRSDVFADKLRQILSGGRRLHDDEYLELAEMTARLTGDREKAKNLYLLQFGDSPEEQRKGFESWVSAEGSRLLPTWWPEADMALRSSIAGYPIIFIPGAGGSRLWRGHGKQTDWQLWPLAYWPSRFDLEFKGDGRTRARAGAPIYAAGILEGDDLQPLDSVPFLGDFRKRLNIYGDLLSSLERQGYVRDKDLFVLAYDWTRSNTEHYGALAALIDTALANQPDGKKKVILMAHSMGGVMARAFLINRLPSMKSRVAALITIATPYHGAPVAYQALVSGYNFENDSFRPQLGKRLAQHMPSVYELLPRKPFIEGSGSTGRGKDSPPTATGQLLSLRESYRGLKYKGLVWEDSLVMKDQWTSTRGNDWWPMAKLLDEADTFHKPQGTPEKPASLGPIKHYVLIGTGVTTVVGYKVRQATVDEEARDRSIALNDGQLRSVVLEPVFGDGDGTVPVEMAQILGATATYHIAFGFESSLDGPTDKEISSRHSRMPANPGVRAVIGRLVRGEVPEGYAHEKRLLDQLLHSKASADYALPITPERLEK